MEIVGGGKVRNNDNEQKSCLDLTLKSPWILQTLIIGHCFRVAAETFGRRICALPSRPITTEAA
jgi:hypothetical protein